MRIHGRTGEGKPRSEVISHGMVRARRTEGRREGSEIAAGRSAQSYLGECGTRAQHPPERENYILEKQKIASLRRIREFRTLYRGDRKNRPRNYTSVTLCGVYREEERPPIRDFFPTRSFVFNSPLLSVQ